MVLIFKPKELLIKLFQEITWLISELEALVSEPNDPLVTRRFYLHLKQVIHGRQIWIGKSVSFLSSGNLILGERCAIGEFSRIENHAPIVIGDDFISAPGLVLNSGSHDPVSLNPNSLPIKIGDRVWCGVNVTILSGVTIGNDVVLGAGSVVCHDIPSNSIAVGIPAKAIKSLHRDPSKPLWTWAITQQREPRTKTPLNK